MAKCNFHRLKYLVLYVYYKRVISLIFLIIILRVSFCSDIWYCNILAYYLCNILAYYLENQTISIIMILMCSCPGNMPKYYPGLRDILPLDNGQYVSQTWVIFWHITWTRPHYYINISAITLQHSFKKCIQMILNWNSKKRDI